MRYERKNDKDEWVPIEEASRLVERGDGTLYAESTGPDIYWPAGSWRRVGAVSTTVERRKLAWAIVHALEDAAIFGKDVFPADAAKIVERLLATSEDAQRVDFLEAELVKARHTGKCAFRVSEHGRGWRLHETSREGAKDTVREALDDARSR